MSKNSTKKPDESSANGTNKDGPTFESALQRLEGIVARLESGELPLEESLALYEEGIGLSRLCHTKLEEAEGRIELLMKDAKGNVARDSGGRARSTPFTAEVEESSSDRPDDVPF